MEYYQVNYKKLAKLPQINYFIIILITIILLIVLLIISCLKYTNKSEIFYGIYDNNILKFKINVELSDIIKNNKIIIFNNQKVSYELLGFEDYEIIDNKIYEIVDLKIDGNFYPNEVGEVKLYYGKEKIITYIFELFK